MTDDERAELEHCLIHDHETIKFVWEQYHNIHRAWAEFQQLDSADYSDVEGFLETLERIMKEPS